MSGNAGAQTLWVMVRGAWWLIKTAFSFIVGIFSFFTKKKNTAPPPAH
jgi:hypothetical protein